MENGATFSVAHAVDTLGFGTFQVCNNFKMSSGAPSFHELVIPSTDFLTAGIYPHSIIYIRMQKMFSH
jgi:hypothetical protein